MQDIRLRAGTAALLSLVAFTSIGGAAVVFVWHFLWPSDDRYYIDRGLGVYRVSSGRIPHALGMAARKKNRIRSRHDCRDGDAIIGSVGIRFLKDPTSTGTQREPRYGDTPVAGVIAQSLRHR